MAVSTENSVKVSKLTLQEMKENRDHEISHYVVAYFEFENQMINLVVENVGKGLAKNVKIEFEPKLVNSINKDINDIPINDIPFIKEGIASMPHKYKVKTFFDSSVGYYGGKKFPDKYKAKITYFGGLNKTKKTTEHILDIGSHYNLLVHENKGFNEVVKELHEISKAQESLRKDFSSYKEVFSNGIWVKNPPFLHDNSNFDLKDDKTIILAKLKEFKILWESVYKNEEMIIGSFNTDMKNRLAH